MKQIKKAHEATGYKGFRVMLNPRVTSLIFEMGEYCVIVTDERIRRTTKKNYKELLADYRSTRHIDWGWRIIKDERVWMLPPHIVHIAQCAIETGPIWGDYSTFLKGLQ